ncbi:hypothetical protein [Anaerosacchariphilus polymeriproducens]|uniref:Uncharacterized protein n=1 Tax=Anaerosacchariphilus polymeriproducens TaxID=1812858 RepID=A0A371AZ10_9FIRM|nr:hypothetical protein [Anaerosacchariphilus polymeriproducens]RDU24835.1 hypothetical protein DWV06_02335 [Anaerosacchariphilus polymeriproducens]
MLKKVLRVNVIVSLLLVISISMTGLIPTTAYASSYTTKTTKKSSYTVLGTYYLSKKAVANMAKKMRAVTSPSATIIEGLLGLTSPHATLAMIAVALSASAVSKTEVLYAADHGMRVKVTIIDYSPHTSYSTVVKFLAVK